MYVFLHKVTSLHKVFTLPPACLYGTYNTTHDMLKQFVDIVSDIFIHFKIISGEPYTVMNRSNSTDEIKLYVNL